MRRIGQGKSDKSMPLDQRLGWPGHLRQTLTRGLAVLALFGVTIAGGQSLVQAAFASQAAPAGHVSLTTVQWRQTLKDHRQPGAGCFTASYPEVQWRATPCKVAPKAPFEPPHDSVSGRPDTVGNGNDYSAAVPGLISSATASFAGVSSGITEEGQYNDSGPPITNAFSLQLNSQFFSTPACGGAASPSACQGWQQYVYDSYNNALFIQYWLIDFNASCPTDWITFDPKNSSDIDCYMNGPKTSLPDGGLTAGDLASVSMYGNANAQGDDIAALYLGDQAISVSNPDGVLGLAYVWNTAEWGVFGDAGGGEAIFGSGDKLSPETQIDSSTFPAAPKCDNEGYTGETNNLTMVATPKITTSHQYPEVESKQEEGGTSSMSCSTAGVPTALNALDHIAYVADNSGDHLLQTATSDELAWPLQAGKVDGQSSSQAPSVVEFDNEYVMAYTSKNSTHDIYVSTSTNGVKWSAGTIVTGQITKSSPSLAVYNGELVMAYIATNGTNDVYITTTTNPLSWPNNGYAIPEESPDPPAMAVYNGDLYMAVRFNNGSYDIGITETTDPSAWGTTQALVSGQQTNTSPALAVNDGDLVMAYIAANGTNDVYVTITTNPLSWPNNGYWISQESPSAPSLFESGGPQLAMALRFNNGSNDIGVTITDDPSDWGTTAEQVPSQLTKATPVIF
jgi:hypothetical protein